MNTLSRRRFLKIMLASAVQTSALGLGVYGYGHSIEGDQFEVNPVTLDLPRLDPAFDGFRLAQISDIHMDYWMRGHFGRVIDLINRAAPDLVVLTGDFVTSEPERYAPDLIQPLRKLDAPALAVLGNHDYWTDAPTVRGILAEAGVSEIGNAVHSIRRGAAALHLAGVDDIWEQKDRLDVVLDQLRDDDHAAILLAHEPDYAPTSAACGRFDLQLSGHSHAGQMIIPGKGPVFLPWLAQHYPAGQYQIGTMIQYTNRGVGMIAPHVRYNCRPEISLFTIRPTAR